MAHETDDSKLKENIVSRAISRLDWPSLHKHLNEVPLTAEAVKKLCRLLRHSGNLIIPFSASKQEARRDEFVGALVAYVESQGTPADLDAVHAELNTLSLAEKPYREFDDALGHCPVSEMPSDKRIAACISWIA
jgi:hypothetical protein